MPDETLKLLEPKDRIVYARKRKQFESASEFAKTYRLSVGTYGGLENGYRNLTPKMAKKIAPLLGVSPSWLMFGGERPIMLQNFENPSRSVNFFLADELAAFMSLASGEYPASAKTIMIDSIAELPERMIVVEVPDRAMSRDTFPSYPEGARAFVSPSTRPTLADYRPEDIVQAVIVGREQAVFREFTKQAGPDGRERIVLRPFNAKYPDIFFDPDRGDKIIGLVVGLIHFAL